MRAPRARPDRPLPPTWPRQEAYKKRLAENLLQSEAKEAKILAFKSKARPPRRTAPRALPIASQLPHTLCRPRQAPAPPEGYDNNLRQLYSAHVAGVKSKKQFRHIPQARSPGVTHRPAATPLRVPPPNGPV